MAKSTYNCISNPFVTIGTRNLCPDYAGTLVAAVGLAKDVGFHVVAALAVVELTALAGTCNVPVPVHVLIRSDV